MPKNCKKNHPRIPLSRYAPDTWWMWRWSYTATLVPTRWIFISPSFFSEDLTHLQEDTEIEVAGGREKEQDSTEAEIEVYRKNPNSMVFFSKF